MGVHGTPEYAKPSKKYFKPKSFKKKKSKQMKDLWDKRKKTAKKTNNDVIKLATYQPYPAQAEFHLALDLGKKVVTLLTGIRYGKTHSGAVECYRQIQKDPKVSAKRAHLGWVIAPTYPMLESVIVPKIQEILGPAILDFKKSPFPRWLFPNPHGPMPYTLEGHTADNPDRLRGAEIDFCWCDEAAMYDEETVDIIMGRLGTTKGQLWCTTTPRGLKHWFAEQFVHKATPGHPSHDPRYYLIKAKTQDNPLMDDMTIEHLRNKYTKDFAAQELDGELVSLSGLVYKFNPSKHTFDHRRFSLKEGDEIIGGIDWGWDDPFVFLFIVKRGNSYYVLDEYFKQHWTVEDHCKFLAGHPLIKKVGRAFADPSQPAARSQVREALGFPVNRGRTERKDLLAGINTVGSLIDHDKLYVASRCKQLIKEFGSYMWVDRDDRNSQDKPMDAYNHGMDALRYVCHSTRHNGGQMHVPAPNNEIFVINTARKQNEPKRRFRVTTRRPKSGDRKNSWMGNYKW